MKYWLDTEFIAKPFTIELISIGLVAEDGREGPGLPREPSSPGAGRRAFGHKNPRQAYVAAPAVPPIT